MTWRKGQFKVKLKIEGEMHIYIIPTKHSYHYLSSIVIGPWDMLSTEWCRVNGIIFCDLGKKVNLRSI